MGLKNQFPSDEREFKSTSIIKNENKNLKKIEKESQNAPNLNDEQKDVSTVNVIKGLVMD